jgi:hypothetical protein
LLRRRQDQPLACLFLSSVHAFSIRADSRLTSCVWVFYSFTHVCFCFVFLRVCFFPFWLILFARLFTLKRLWSWLIIWWEVGRRIKMRCL